MSAVLRVDGTDFDVDAFLAGCSLSAFRIYRRGEPCSQLRPRGRRHDSSGANFVISDADFDEFPRQAKEATTFLRENFEQIRRLCEWPGVDGVSLDFGIARRNVLAQCDILPADLIRLAGLLGLEIEISQYPAVEDSA